MAIFNPAVAPGRDDMPNWQRAIGGPISDLVADKSAGLAYSTAATGIEGGAELLKQTAEGIVKKDVRDTVEPIREDFTKELELARQAQTGGAVPPAVQGTGGASVGSTANLYMGTQAPVPEAINAGLSKVQA